MHLPISSLCLIYSADALNSSFFTNTTITVSHACNYHHETSIIFIILQMVKMRDSLALGHNESAVEVGSHLSFLNSFFQTVKFYEGTGTEQPGVLESLPAAAWDGVRHGPSWGTGGHLAPLTAHSTVTS